MTTYQTHIAFQEVRSQVEIARADIEKLKAQQVQQLVKARLQVENANAGIEELPANEGDFWNYKIWQLSQVSFKWRGSQNL